MWGLGFRVYRNCIGCVFGVLPGFGGFGGGGVLFVSFVESFLEAAGPPGWGPGTGVGVAAFLTSFGLLSSFGVLWCVSVMLFVGLLFYRVKDEGLLHELLVMKCIQFLFILSLRA